MSDDEPGADPAAAAGWRRTAVNAFLIGFLALQLALPVRGFVLTKQDSRGDLSWNMYSKRYSCRVGYVVHAPDGRRERVDHKSYFRRAKVVGRVFHRDVLPTFHAHMCAELRRERRLGTLRGSVNCSLNDGPRQQLVRTDVDLCSTANWGVIGRAPR